MSSGCKVCGRPVPRGEKQYCCPGCAAVYTIIEQLNLEGAAKDERVAQLLEGVFPGGEEVESHDIELENGESLSLIIDGMVCPACAWLVHNRLTKLEGVGGVNVNFITETCELQIDPMRLGREEVEMAVADLGYRTYDSGTVRDGIDYFRFGAGWFFALNTMMISFVVYSAESWSVPLTMQWVCSLFLVIFGTWVPLYAARDTMRMGFRQIRLGAFRMESLVVVSTTAAWIYSII
ncbi:MAG: cation transporter, partial [Pontiellaceae bacterium]